MKNFFILLLIIFISKYSYAYLGPGIGGGVVAATLALLVAIFAALFAIIWFPLKRLIIKIKENNKNKNKID